MSVVTARERICWQIYVHLSAAHTAGCLVLLRTLRWFSTIAHWRYFLTNLVCAGYYSKSGPLPWTLAGLQRAEYWGTDSGKQWACWWCVPVSCAWSPRQAPGLSQPHHTPSRLVLKLLVPSSGQHRPLLETQPVSKAAELSFPKCSLF